MRPTIPMLLLLLSGCDKSSPVDEPAAMHDQAPVAPQTTLSEGEVLRIADAEAERLKMQSVGSPRVEYQASTRSWKVFYSTAEPPQLDACFVIFVDDRTKSPKYESCS